MDGEGLLKKANISREDREMDLTPPGGQSIAGVGALSPAAEQQNAAWSDRYDAAVERYKLLEPHSQEALASVAAGLTDWAAGLPYRGFKPDGRPVSANRWGLGAERCVVRGLRSCLVTKGRKSLAERIGSEMADLLETARSLDYVCLAAQPDPRAEKRLTGTAQIQARTLARFLGEIDLERQRSKANPSCVAKVVRNLPAGPTSSCRVGLPRGAASQGTGGGPRMVPIIGFGQEDRSSGASTESETGAARTSRATASSVSAPGTPAPRVAAKLSDAEEIIIEALGRETMTGEVVAKKAGYPFNSNFKSTLSSMRKRGLLGNASPGYFLTDAYLYLLDACQDKGQD